jgi:hypothetical protein
MAKSMPARADGRTSVVVTDRTTFAGGIVTMARGGKCASVEMGGGVAIPERWKGSGG